MGNKVKHQATLAVVNRYGLLLALFMALLGVLGGALAMFIAAPTLYNHEATRALLDRQASTLLTAAQDQQARATADAQALQATALALTALQDHQVGETQRLLDAIQSVVGTARALDEVSTQSAALWLLLEASQTALARQSAELALTAIQSAAQVAATRTASAALNVQQQTQVAIDFAQTQAALQQNATQAQLSFQATQAALQQAATLGAPLVAPLGTPTP